MSKLNSNEKHQKIFNPLNNYKHALINKQREYVESVKTQHEKDQKNALNNAFVLDLMIKLNQQQIDYLDFLQTCNNDEINQILDTIDTEKLDYISINKLLIENKELIKKQCNRYWARSVISFSLAMMIAGGSVAIIILANPVGIAIFAALVASLAIGILAGSYAATAISSEEKYHSFTQHFNTWLKQEEGTHEATFRAKKKETIRLSDSKEKLINQFFLNKNIHNKQTLCEEVEEEYKASMNR